MAKKRNAFTSDLESFLKTCGDIAHLHYFTHSQLKGVHKKIAQAYAKIAAHGKQKYFKTGTALSLVDLFSKSEWIERAPAETRATAGKNISRLAEELESRSNAFVLVALHETFEVFLHAIYGQMLYQLRDEVTLPDKQSYHRAFPAMAKKERTLPYFRKYAQFACKRDCAKALNVLVHELDTTKLIIDIWHGMSLPEAIAVVGFCRHHIVHVGGQITDEDIRTLGKAQQQFVKKCMKDGVITGENTFLPAHDLTDHVIEIFASYAYALYVLLARRFSMTVDYGPQKE